MPNKKHYSTCTLCEAMCGIEVTTEGRDIVSIAGDKANPFSEGHVCPKAAALKDLYDDPQRIKTPLKKVDGEWQDISWEQAYSEIADRIVSIQEQHGNNAVATYLGNPNAHNMGSILFGPYFYRALKTHNHYSATSVDQLPHHIVSTQLFGHQQQIPIPDIDHTDHFMIIGGNPLASNGSIMTVPHIKRRLKAIQKRGGKVVVIDPKRSETADISCEHHFVKPGSDALMLLAMLNTLYRKGLVNPGQKLIDLTPDLDRVQDYVAPYTPERVSPHIGISPETIEQMVADFCAADSAVCYGRMGASVQVFGTLSQYLIMLFNLLTGNLDRRGGMMFTQPAMDFLKLAGRGKVGRYKTRVRGLPGFGGEYPVSCLAEEMTTEGEGQIKALFIGAGNPVLTTPNGEQLDSAIQQLDLVVAADFFITESTRHADYILPPVTALERDHYDVVFHNNAVRNSAKYSEALFEPDENHRTDWQIYLSLAEHIDQRRGQDTSKYEALWTMQPKGVVDKMLRTGLYGEGEHQLSVQKLIDNPHGIDLGPLQPDLPEALYHEDKQIHLSFDYFMGDLARLDAHFFATETANDGSLQLIGRRHLKSNNSWLHNSQRMVKGRRRCTAQIHPDDAQQHAIADGTTIEVRSRVGQVQIEAEVTDKIMPGVISIPHGWGHNKSGTQWQIAEANAGVNVNELTDEMLVDELSGNAVLNGVPVWVKAIA